MYSITRNKHRPSSPISKIFADVLEKLGRLGRSGHEAVNFHWLHQVSLDSRGNIYTAEVDTGKRIQKFIRYGDLGCSSTGRATVGGVLP
jgi:hypothetical protein